MKRIKYIALILIALLATACRHKELCLDHTHALEVEVVYDWSNDPSARPASMAAYFFIVDKSIEPIRYDFAGRDGGSIIITPGLYSALGFNSDVIDWARFIGTDDIETFTVITREAEALSAFGFDAGIVNKLRVPEADEERVAMTPQMFWCDRQDGINLQKTAGKHVVTFYPQDPMCHYTVTVLDIENFEYLKGASVLDATLSSMAEGYMLGRMTATDTRVTMPFELSVPEGTQNLHSEFLTFGECPHSTYSHNLAIYVAFADGTAASYNFDVTDQVKNAPDPRHVDIVISGLVIPKPVADFGLTPEVNEWVSNYIDLTMP